jgi:hypothetical protein
MFLVLAIGCLDSYASACAAGASQVDDKAAAAAAAEVKAVNS